MKATIVPFLALCLIAASPAWADIGRDDAAAIAQKTTGGRVLAIEKIKKDGRDVWRVKIVTTQGEVQVIYLDVETGKAA